jgi:two-component system sensor histidine kinase BaeS
MLRTLRRWFLLSHVLPLLVILPIVGIALIYVLESQVLLPSLADELVSSARVLSVAVGDRPTIWDDPAQAQVLLTRVRPDSSTRAMLLSPLGRVLASSSPGDTAEIGQVMNHPGIARALDGEISVHTDYSRSLQSEITDVFAPVLDTQGQILGLVRLSYRLTHVQAWFLRLRYLIAGVLAFGLLLGVATGLVLAARLGRSVQQTTQAVYQLASDQRLEPLPERGPREMRLLAQAVNTLADRRRNVERSNRQLLSNLVHELGRPLGACSSTVEALRDGAAEDVALRTELLDGMASEVQGLRRLLDDLAQLNERVAGKLDLKRRPIRVAQWLSQASTPWREAARAKGLHWEAHLPADLPEMVIDPERLGQALGNLLSNAIKYTPAGGTVSIQAGTADQALWVRVGDTGPGIAPEDQAHVFSPFYRAQRAGEPQPGMGLGLTIAHDLVAAHGGRLELKSEPGAGSRFTLLIPLELKEETEQDRVTFGSALTR